MRLNLIKIYQKGTALLMALFIMSLTAAASVAMLIRIHVDFRQHELIFNNNQASLYLQGSIDWAVDQLTTNWKNHILSGEVDKLPSISPINQEGHFKIVSRLDDMQSLLNVNNLVSSDYDSIFLRFLNLHSSALELNKSIVSSIREWITPIIKNSSVDNIYLKLTPSYRPPHKPMASISELRLVKNISPSFYEKMSPFMTALPEQTPVNINSAPLIVLMSLSPSLSQESAAKLIALRQKNLFQTKEEFLNLALVQSNHFSSNITTLSDYFLLTTNINATKQQLVFKTLLKRTADDENININILWQTQGTL